MSYYAEHCPYGVDTISDYDSLLIFVTREERDEMVGRLNKINEDILAGVCSAITRKDAAKHYRVQDIGTEYEKEISGHVLKTCAGRNVFEVGSKRGGALVY